MPMVPCGAGRAALSRLGFGFGSRACYRVALPNSTLRIGWGLVFQRVRNFYHFKFSPREPNFYHFKLLRSPQLLPDDHTFFSNFRFALRARMHPQPRPMWSVTVDLVKMNEGGRAQG